MSLSSFGPLISLRLRSWRSSSVADGSLIRSISWAAISGCFRGSVRSRLPSMSRFKLQLDKPKDGFGQCRFVALFSCPGVHHFHAVRTKDGWSLRHHARWCDGLSLYARPYASFSFHLHHLPTQRRSQSPRRKAAVIPALPGAYALWACSCRSSVRNIYCAHVFSSGVLTLSNSPREGSRDPARATSLCNATLGRGSRWRANPPNRRGRSGDCGRGGD